MAARSEGDVAPHVVGPFACFGQHWRISCDDAALGRLLGELYAPMLVPTSDARPTVTYRVTVAGGELLGAVYRDEQLLGRDLQPSRLMGKLVWAINRQVIDAAGSDLLLHAAAASDDDGRVILLPAPMESGKTTLVTGLLDRGLAYLTDEAAAVDRDLTVRGFAKPLSIDKGSWDTLGHHASDLSADLAAYMSAQWQVPPHRFTTVVPCGPLAMVVFPTYVTGEATSLTRLTPVAALDLVRASTFGPEDRPLTTTKVARLAHMVAAVACFELRSGDLADACAAVLEEHAGARRVG